ncbi:MAG: protein serine/threonine phosphatase [Flavipsychrobacter sp.]|jgi:hypothetical protein|nr:protein serine/threonine phosphatase [Flavipsychrobacter sp.]
MKMIKQLLVIVLVCMYGICSAQDAPPPAPPPGKDTSAERLKKSMEELDQLLKDFDQKYSTKPADGPVMRVGDKKDGGTVYWVDGTGKHGLIVWPDDLGIKKWEESDQACKKLGAGWRLPTKDELDKLYKANVTLQILSSYFFFHSSTEESPGVVWRQSLSSGTLKTGYKTGTASTAAVKGF